MRKMHLRFWGLTSLLLLICLTGLHAQTGARADCFPFEELPPDQRKAAEELLLKALDGEALYTIVGGLKPMSSGFESMQFRVQLPRMDYSEAEKTVKELSVKNNGILDKVQTSRLRDIGNCAEEARD